MKKHWKCIGVVAASVAVNAVYWGATAIGGFVGWVAACAGLFALAVWVSPRKEAR